MRYTTAFIASAIILTLAVGCRKSSEEEEILPPPKIVKVLPGTANPLRRMYEVEELGPEVTRGELTADPAASNQVALYVKPGAVKHNEYVAWGPYEELAPGGYVARWRIKANQVPANDEPVLSLDVSGYPKDDRSNYMVLVSRPLSGRDFPEGDKYYTFNISFDVERPFVFELRTQYLQDVELWLDWTSIELVQ